MDMKNRRFSRLKKSGFFNNKGLMAGKTVKIILAVVGGVIVIGIAIIFIIMITAPSIDKMCYMGNSMRHAVSLDIGMTIYFWPQMCDRQSCDITPDSWDDCPAIYLKYGETKDKNERLKLLRECAIQQVAEVVRRAWVAAGSGGLDPGDYEAYQFSTLNYPEGVDLDITEDDIQAFMKTHNVTGGNITYYDSMDFKDKYLGMSNTITINENEMWIAKFDDADYYGGDFVDLYPASGVEVVDLPGESCIRDTSCFEICGGTWGDGYSNDLGKTCFMDQQCTLECVNKTAEAEEASGVIEDEK